MRKKLLVLSALTCIVGGSALLAPTPAASQSETIYCEDFLWRQCFSTYLECTRRDSGVPDWLMCDGSGTYVWA